MSRISKKKQMARHASLMAQQAPPAKLKENIRKRLAARKTALAKQTALKKLRETYLAIVNGDINTDECPHFMVGAASFRRLLAGSYGPREAHGHLQFREAPGPTLWAHCERESESMNSGCIRQRLVPHPFIPFVCAKSDLYDEKNNLVIETKSTRDSKTLRQYDKGIISATLLQMIVTMECFGTTCGLLNVFTADDDQKTPGKCRPYRTHCINLHQRAPFFTEGWLGNIAKAYAFFLMRLREVDFDDKVHADFSNFIENNLRELHKKYHSTTNRGFRYLQHLSENQRRHLVANFTTDFCRKWHATERKKPISIDGELVKSPEIHTSGFNKSVGFRSLFETDYSKPTATYNFEFSDADREKHFQRFSVCFERNKALALAHSSTKTEPSRTVPYALFANLTVSAPESEQNSHKNDNNDSLGEHSDSDQSVSPV